MTNSGLDDDHLPLAVRQALTGLEASHPPGAEGRALLAAAAIHELVRGWSGPDDSMLAATEALVDRILNTAQGTAHQPGVRNAIAFMTRGTLPVDRVRAEAVLAERRRWIETSFAASEEQMAAAGAALLESGDRILVHDYAEHSTQAVVRRAAEEGKKLEIIATACRSRRADGLRVADEALALGHSVWVVTDAGIAWAVTYFNVVAAFLGADSVIHDGSLLTTPGALAIGLAARMAGVPVYAVADLWKVEERFSRTLQSINQTEDPDGVPEALEWSARGLHYLNPLVDVVPGELITAFITEHGAINPAHVGATSLAVRSAAASDGESANLLP